MRGDRGTSRANAIGVVLPRFLAACLLLSIAFPAFALTNQLAGHPSPYLAMHGSDPVAWQQWGPGVMERARREKKLVYISSGYFSCHWCHVMQQESYRDTGIAAFLNQHFIPVKIDRELEPALDARLIGFMESTRGMSGWPLNVFITPDGAPLFGVLYLPPQEFLPALQRLQKLWTEQPQELRQLAERNIEAEAAPAKPATLDRAQAQRYAIAAVKEALAQADIVHGGFGQESKFPLVPQLAFLLERAGKNAELKSFLLLTLDEMAANGLQDHVAGGFFRYTVDPAWRTPHFEKMLYDNAQLAALYLRAGRAFGRKDYERVARRTLDFMLADMRAPGGAFIASLSAVDERGVEGGHYLWTRDELKQILTPSELNAYLLAFGVRDAPPFEAGYLPIAAQSPAEVAKSLGRPRADVERLLDSAQSKLRAARAKRALPRDTKQLAGWNGLALSALVLALRNEDSGRYRAAARDVRDYLARVLFDGRRLRRAMAGEREIGAAAIEDYAYVAQGLWDWAELTGADADYALAKAVLLEGWKRFYGANGWRLEERPLIKTRPELVLADGHMPSPSAVMIDLTVKLAARTRDASLRERARSALAQGQGSISENALWHVSTIGAMLAPESLSGVPARADDPRPPPPAS